jgi:hypothetical protein
VFFETIPVRLLADFCIAIAIFMFFICDLFISTLVNMKIIFNKTEQYQKLK